MPNAHQHPRITTSRLALRLAPALLLAATACQSGDNSKPRELRPPQAAPPTIHLGSHDADAIYRSTTTRAAGTWVPNAIASFLTIDRSTSYALVHDPDISVLIIAAAETVEPEADSNWPTATTRSNILYWVVELPNQPSHGQTVAIGQRHRAWLLERVPGLPTHGSPAHGTVTVITSLDDTLILDLDIAASIGRPTAGQTLPPSIRTSERVSLQRRQPITLTTPEIDSESGASTRPEPVRLPIWTALGPDEWKPAGWQFESPGRRRR